MHKTQAAKRVAAEKAPSVEQIDKLIESALQPAKSKAGGQKNAALLKNFNLCETYGKGGRAVLLIAKGLLFFKPKWAAVVVTLITHLDEICEQ